MAEKKALVVYAAAYENVDAALARLSANHTRQARLVCGRTVGSRAYAGF
jgi:hypothetical protein